MAQTDVQPQSQQRRFGAALSVARWEPLAASLCLAQISEPLFAPIAASQGLTEPPGIARIFFLPVYAFLLWAAWRDRKIALRTLASVPLLLALLALCCALDLLVDRWRRDVPARHLAGHDDGLRPLSRVAI